jgi:homoserine dehydrogenase
LGGTIKPTVCARHAGAGVEAFVGPAFVPLTHPLASLGGTLNGIQLSGRYVSNLFFSGPGAGPDVTAATVLDDVIESVSTERRLPKGTRERATPSQLRAPATEWFIRVRFPGVVPDARAAGRAFTAAGLTVSSTTNPQGGAQWLRIQSTPIERVSRAINELQRTHRIDGYAIRSL